MGRFEVGTELEHNEVELRHEGPTTSNVVLYPDHSERYRRLPRQAKILLRLLSECISYY
jgi:hypothetical protein